MEAMDNEQTLPDLALLQWRTESFILSPLNNSQKDIQYKGKNLMNSGIMLARVMYWMVNVIIACIFFSGNQDIILPHFDYAGKIKYNKIYQLIWEVITVKFVRNLENMFEKYIEGFWYYTNKKTGYFWNGLPSKSKSFTGCFVGRA